MLTISKKIGLYLAILHSIGFVITIIRIYFSTDPQAPLMWMVFAIIDFPISLLYSLLAHIPYFDIEELPFFLGVILYPPHIIHGLIGGIWWYYLPRLFTPKRFGGIWGKKKQKSGTQGLSQ